MSKMGLARKKERKKERTKRKREKKQILSKDNCRQNKALARNLIGYKAPARSLLTCRSIPIGLWLGRLQELSHLKEGGITIESLIFTGPMLISIYHLSSKVYLSIQLKQ